MNSLPLQMQNVVLHTIGLSCYKTVLLKKLIYFLFLLTALLIACYYLQPKKTGKGKDNFTRYELVKDWPKLPGNFALGNPTGVGIDTNQNVFIFHRAGRNWPLFGSMPNTNIASNTILLLDRLNGKILNSWGGNLFIMPHGLTVDKNNNVWVTDVGLHQVFKFSHDGHLLMKLGESKIPGNDSAHFNRPTDVAVADDGSFYVSDGYENSRIIKFSPLGKYLFEWGEKGSNKGEFNIPHGIDLDEKGNVYVADRENSRIQVFDSSGKFLNQWSEKSFGNICSVAFDKIKEKLIAVDDVTFFKLKHRGSDIIIFDSAGIVQTRLGRSGFYDGPLCWYHDVAIDNEESIYIGDILGNKIQKFKKSTSP
jgi:peptidylamidoglycolate lyase